MSDELVIPSTEGFCRFVEAYFIDREYTVDTKSRSRHIVYRIPSHDRNISVPISKRGRLATTTFNDLLLDMKLDTEYYREHAGTPDRLKAYCKARKREHKAG